MSFDSKQLIPQTDPLAYNYPAEGIHSHQVPKNHKICKRAKKKRKERETCLSQIEIYVEFFFPRFERQHHSIRSLVAKVLQSHIFLQRGSLFLLVTELYSSRRWTGLDSRHRFGLFHHPESGECQQLCQTYSHPTAEERDIGSEWC